MFKSADKFLSLAVVWLMLFSSFVGLLVFETDNTEAALGDVLMIDYTKVVDRTTPGVDNGIWPLDKSLHIVDGGKLILDNVTLQVLSEDGEDTVPGTADDIHYWIHVDGGELLVNNSVITMGTNQISPYLFLNLTLNNIGQMYVTNGSRLSFPGWLNITGWSTFYCNDSVITFLDVDDDDVCDLDASEIEDPHNNLETWYWYGTVKTDGSNDAPRIFIQQSNVTFADSEIRHYYENTDEDTLPLPVDCAALGGLTNYTDIELDDNTYVDVTPLTSMTIDGFNVTYLPSMGRVDLHVIYMCNSTMNSTSYMQWKFDSEIEWRDMDADPLERSIRPVSSETTEVERVYTLEAVYTTQQLETLDVRYANNGATGGDVSFDRVWVEVTPAVNYNISVENKSTFTAINTYMDLDYLRFTVSGLKNVLEVRDNSTAKLYNVTVDELETNPDYAHDYPPFRVIDIKGNPYWNAEIQIYRWGIINVVDFLGQPVANATVNATCTQDNDVDSEKNWTLKSWQNNTLKTNDTILQYLNRTRTRLNHPADFYITNETYNKTDEYGGPIWLPLLTDVIRPGYGLNGESFGTYEFYIYNESWVKWTNFTQDSFQPFPDIQYTDNVKDIYIQNNSLSLASPDLVVDSITFNPTLPKRGDSVQITANVENVGKAASPANKLVVWFYDIYDGTPSLIGSTPLNTPIVPGGNANAVINWQTYTSAATMAGNHTIQVVIDEEIKIVDDNRTNNTESKLLYLNLSVDLEPTTLTVDTDQPYYETDTLSISSIITNNGAESVPTAGFNVAFYYQRTSFPTIGWTLINTVTMGTGTPLAAGASSEGSVTWIPPSNGTYQFRVIADEGNQDWHFIGNVREYDETNNGRTTGGYEVHGLSNLNAINTNITFDNAYPRIGDKVNITMKVYNDGKNDTDTDFYMRFFDDLNGNGVYDAGEEINTVMNASVVLSGTDINSNVTWTPTTRGWHDIYVELDYDEDLRETNEADNVVHVMIYVFNDTQDLIVNDTLPDSGGVYLIENNPDFSHYRYTLVEENGILRIDNSVFRVIQDADYEYSIVVKDNGVLEINNSVLTSTHNIIVYLYDNARLYINNSNIMSNVDIVSASSSSNVKVQLYESTVSGEFSSQVGVTTYLDATNCTFGNGLTEFGGNSIANLTDVTTSGGQAIAVTLQESAKAYRYWWLTVYAVDTNGKEVPNASITVNETNILPETLYATQLTGPNGVTTFKLLAENITKDDVIKLDKYGVNGTFDALSHASNKNYVRMILNNQTTLTFGSVKPNLYPDFIDTDQTTYIINENAVINVTVFNSGDTTAYDVVVNFYLDGWSTLIGTTTIANILPGGSVNATLSWTATPVGNHTIYVYVDEDDDIDESDDTPTNNQDSLAAVIVYSKPDLEPTVLKIEPDTPGIGSKVFLNASIINNGDAPSGAFNVSFWDGPVGTGVLLGNDSIANIPGKNTAWAKINTTTLAGGAHTIWVFVDAKTPDDVPESNEGNNKLSNTTTVTRADLEISQLALTPGNLVVLGDVITLTATVSNTGGTSAPNAVVRFYLDTVSAGTQIGGDQATGPIAGSGGTAPVVETWNALTGAHIIYAVVDVTYLVDEGNEFNNEISESVQVLEEPFDLIVNGTDSFTIPNGIEYMVSGYVLVEDDGVLNLDGTLYLSQQTKVVVRGNGSLIMDGGWIKTDFDVPMEVYGSAELTATDSDLDLISLTLSGDANVTLTDVDVVGTFESSDRTNLDAVNVTMASLSFADDSWGNITNVNLVPTLTENATVSRYWWLNVLCMDAQDIPLENVWIQVKRVIINDDVSQDTSNYNGIARFALHAENITASSTVFFGNYWLNATYWDVGVPKNLTASALMTDNLNVTLKFEDVAVGPDLVVKSITFDPPLPGFGEPVQITVNVNNTGQSSASEFTVRVYYDVAGNVIGLNTTSGALGPNANVDLEFTWIGGASGVHNIYAVADTEYNVSETDEDNNEKVKSVTIGGRPDLEPTDLRLTPVSPFIDGEMVTLTLSVENSGGTSVPFSNVSFYLDDIALANRIGAMQPITDILSYNTATVLASVVWPAAGPGTHTIYAVVDVKGEIIESDETNNVTSMEIRVLSAINDDLIINDATGNFEINAGTQYTLGGYVLVEENAILYINGVLHMLNPTSIVVRGNGQIIMNNASAKISVDNSLDIVLYDNGTLDVIDADSIGISSQNVNIIAGGPSNATAYPGSHITICLNETDIYGEVNSGTDVDTLLWATNAVFSQPFDEFGGDSRANLTNVVNTEGSNLVVSNVAQNALVYIFWYLDVYHLDGNGVPIQNANATVWNYTHTEQIEYQLSDVNGISTITLLSERMSSTGSRYYWNYKVEGEYDTGSTKYWPTANTSSFLDFNKVAYLNYDSAMPELTVYDVVVVPAGGAENDILTVYSNINNTGDSPARNVLVKFYLNNQGTLLNQTTITNIPVGGSANVSVKFVATPGVGDMVLAYVDPDDTVDELFNDTFGNNSRYSAPFDVSGAVPDLIISAITFEYQGVTAGSGYNDTTIDVIATVKNVDMKAVSTSFWVKFKYNITDSTWFILGEVMVTVSDLGTNEEVNVSTTWDLIKPGTFTVNVEADSRNDIDSERSELNNSREENFTVNPRPNIIVSSITYDDDTPEVGQAITINASITNIGDEEINVSKLFWIRIYDDNALIGTAQIGGLASHDTQVVSIVWTPGYASYHIIEVDSDWNNTINLEMSETDNSFTSSILVYRGDVPKDIIVGNSPLNETLTIGYSITHTGYILVENQGTLTITETLTMSMSENFAFNIRVKDEGKLVINSALITSGRKLNLYLEDNAMLFLNDSTLNANINIVVEGNAKLFISGSLVEGSFSMANADTPDIRFINTTFYKPITIEQNAYANLTNIEVNSLTVEDSAFVRMFRWLTVNVEDVNGIPLSDANVFANFSLSGTAWAQGLTNNGILLIEVLVNEVDGLFNNFYGNYLLTANYTDPQGTTHWSPTNFLAMPEYDLTQLIKEDNEEVTLSIESVKPELWLDSDEIVIVPDPTAGAGLSEGNTVTVTVPIHNTGNSTAENVYIYFFLNGFDSMIDLWYIPSIAPNSIENAEATWDVLEGLWTIHVWIDRIDIVDEGDDTQVNNTGTSIGFNVESAKPDLTIDEMWVTYKGDAAHITTGYRDTEVTLYAIINNTGNENITTDFEVRFVHNSTSGDVLIGTFNVVGGLNMTTPIAMEVSEDWLLSTLGTYTLTISVDSESSIDEMETDNNDIAMTFTVLPRPNLVVEWIRFDDTTPIVGQSITINATVTNIGDTIAAASDARFYADGVEIGTIGVVPLAAGASTDVQLVDWIPAMKGDYEIKVKADWNNQILETDNQDNELTEDIWVYFTDEDIIVDGDNVVDITNYNNPEYWLQGNVLVEDNGTLRITDSILYIDQVVDNEYRIVVRDNGVLEITRSSLISNRPLKIILLDNARLYVNYSSFGNLIYTKIMSPSSSMFMESSTIDGYMDEIYGDVTAYNSTISRTPIFLENSHGYLTDTYAKYGLDVRDSSTVWIYWWLSVYTLDGNAELLDGVIVNVYQGIPPVLYATGMSQNGMVVFRTLEMIETSTRPWFRGNYIIDGDYNYTFPHNYSYVVYNSDLPSPTVKMDGSKSTAIIFTGVLPDLDPIIKVESSVIAKSHGIWINVTSFNFGSADAHNAWLRVEDDYYAVDRDSYLTPWSEDWQLSFMDTGVIPAGGKGWANFTWYGKYAIGTHNLTMTVNPMGNISEYGNVVKVNWTDIEVISYPDFQIESIIMDPEKPTEHATAEVEAIISNEGDVIGNDVPVNFYYSPMNANTWSLIGTDTLSSINRYSSTQASIEWVNLPVSGYYDIRVIVNEADSIIELNTTNNQNTTNIYIQTEAEIKLNNIIFDPSSQAMRNSNVEIEVAVINDGQTEAHNVLVQFIINRGSTWTTIGEHTIASIANGAEVEVSEKWVATLPVDILEDTIFVFVNTTLLGETVTENKSLDIYDPRADLIVTDTDLVVHTTGTSVIEGQTFQLNVTVHNTNSVLNQRIGKDAWNVSVEVWNTTLTGQPGIRLTNTTVELITMNHNVTAYLELILWGVGTHDLIVLINSDDKTDEFEYDNNDAIISVPVIEPEIRVIINQPTSGMEYDVATDSTMSVRGRLVPAPHNRTATSGTVRLLRSGQVVETATLDIAASGDYTATLSVPAIDTELVRYDIQVTVIYETRTYDSQINRVDVISVPEPPETPWWLYITIIIVIVGAIGGVSAFMYKYGLGKFVECGDCGEIIPIGSTTCPKCGVEFETEKAKCSVCGAWIPIKSDMCSDCGAEFVAVSKETKEYRVEMLNEYEKMLEGHKGEAAEALEDEDVDIHDDKFKDWWKTQPAFVSFDDWLNQEEGERAAQKPMTCEGCGSLNPPGADMCFKCGTEMMGGAEGESDKGGATAAKSAQQKKLVKKVSAPPVQTTPVEEAPEAEIPEAAAPVVAKKVIIKKPAEGQSVVAKKVVIKKPAEGQAVVPKKVVIKKPVKKEEL
jgi:subtilase family serine protease